MKYHDFDEILPSLKGDERYYKFVEMVEENRPFYSEKTAELIEKTLENPEFTKKYGHRNGSIAEALGVNLSAITRIRRPTFVVSPKVFQELCHNIFHCSCQQILFNDKNAVSALPKKIGAAANAMEDVMLHERKKILAQVEKIRRDYERENGAYVINRAQIPWLRIKEYSEEQFKPTSTCLGDYVGWKASLIISNMKKLDRAGPRLDTMMYFSWAMGTTIDSLMVQDYTKATSIGYRYGNRVVKISDASIIKTVGNILSLPEDLQSKCIAIIFKACERTE